MIIICMFSCMCSLHLCTWYIPSEWMCNERECLGVHMLSIPICISTSLLFILMSMQVCVCVFMSITSKTDTDFMKKKKKLTCALWHWQTRTHSRGKESGEIREDGGESDVICIYELKLFATDWVCITWLHHTAGWVLLRIDAKKKMGELMFLRWKNFEALQKM